jgi:hypothetical protein
VKERFQLKTSHAHAYFHTEQPRDGAVQHSVDTSHLSRKDADTALQVRGRRQLNPSPHTEPPLDGGSRVWPAAHVPRDQLRRGGGVAQLSAEVRQLHNTMRLKASIRSVYKRTAFQQADSNTVRWREKREEGGSGPGARAHV